MGSDTRKAALEKLDPFIGRWRLEASFGPGGSSEDAAAFCVFERELGGEFVVGRSHAPDPAPDSLTIIRFDPTSETYSQHYFDSRGVVRVYAMTLAHGVWTLLRVAPDFSPLEFSQRFTGRFGDDGSSIVGRWETSKDGSTWEHDFDLIYSKVT